MSGSKPFTPADREHAFRQVTSRFTERYACEIEQGMTDDQLEVALKEYFGIFGGSCGPGMMCLTRQGSGLKIWASWDIHNHVLEKPIFQGSATVRMARELYKIPDPADTQLPLF